MTVADLELRRRALAASACAAGLKFGQRILVAMAGGPEPVADALAVACFGRALLVDAELPRAEAEAVLHRLRPDGVLHAEAPWEELARDHDLPLIRCANVDLGATSADEPQAADTAVVLHTSGTVGEPRCVPLSHRNLLSAARHGALALRLNASDRVLDLRPGHHASSLVGAVLASLVSGGVAIRPKRFDVALFFEWLERHQPTWYTAVPAVHEAIAAEARRRGPRPTSLRFVRSSAASLPPMLAAELEHLLGAPVLDGYGMTEAPLIATARAGDSPRPAGIMGPPAGVEIAIRDGEVLVRGDAVMTGYESAHANATAFVDGWFRTGDLGSLDADGRLILTGRLGDRINRGGEKVDPAEVEAALRRHPAVADVAVLAVPHARLGEEVAAAIVRRSAADVTAAGLRRSVASDLAAFKVPRRIAFVAGIPRDGQGKVRRGALAELFAPMHRDRPRRPIAPDEAHLAAIWAEVLGVEHVATTDDFFDLGGDSLAAASILARVEGELGARLPLAVFFEAATVEALTAAIGGVPLTTAGPAVVLREGRGRPPFFCVHGLGGTAFRLAALAKRLPDELPFVALQAPGLDGREAPLTRIEALAELYLGAIAARQSRGPYLLGGFCMGGAVAYEMACRLEARGEKVALLALIDPPPLPLGFRRRPQERLRVAATAALQRLRLRAPGPPIGEDESPVMQANRRALRRYRPGRYRGSVWLFCASDGPEGATEDAEASMRGLVAGSVESVAFPGEHMDLVLEPGVARVAAELERALHEASAGARS